jgi:V/A-type H+/Na+-transporting ATPase subunit I
MIRAKSLSKITVFGLKSYMKPVIEVMYDMNVLHIEDHSKKGEEDIFDIGEPFESNEKFAELLVKSRALISNLGVSFVDTKPNKDSIEKIEKELNEADQAINDLLSKANYYAKIKKAYEGQLIEKALSGLKVETEKDFDYSKASYYIGFVNRPHEKLEGELEKSGKKISIQTSNFEDITLMALFVEGEKKDNLKETLDAMDFSPIDLPVVKREFKTLKSSPGQKYGKLNGEYESVNKKLAEALPEVEETRKKYQHFLISTERRLKMETTKAEAPLRFGTTKNSFLVKGWIATDSVKKLEDELKKATEGKVMLKAEKAKKSEVPPVLFNHPKIVQPFEAFMELYTLPSYKEIDPTFFMFLTFPLFFGMMLGDVGYGLVTLLIFSIVKKKVPGAKNFMNALIISSFVSILFGAAFGEYFGVEYVSPELGKALGIHAEKITSHGVTETIYPIPHLFSRSHRISDLLSFTIVMGIVHILIGQIIGFINVYNNHGLKHAITEKFGWMLMMPGIAWLLVYTLNVVTGDVASFLKGILPATGIVTACAVIGFILLMIGEGIMGIIELPALLSNVLSYARLMAVGLASLSMAVIINDIAGELFHSGIGGIIGAILLLIVGHSINIALGILSPFLHSLRLHYVEFFTKFYRGGGKRFQSFGQN